MEIGPYFILNRIKDKPVLFGVHKDTDKRVALKYSNPFYVGSTNPVIVGEICLEYEYNLQSRLEHPNICPVEEFLKYRGMKYLVTPKVGAQTFEKLLIEGCSDSRKLGVLENIASALAHTHEKDIVHLDVKEGNVVVGEKGMLIDFGSAREICGTPEIIDSIVSNTVRVTAPEYLQGNWFTPRSDTFSFAIMAYEAMTDAPAFQRYVGTGGRHDREEIMYNRPRHDRKKMQKFGGFGELVISGLNVDEPKRPGMAELADALKEQTAKQGRQRSVKTSEPSPVAS